jgi:hypothetical protein
VSYWAPPPTWHRSRRAAGPAGTGFVIETAGGVPRRVCDGCELHGFLADHHSVLAVLNDGHALRVIDVRTGNARDLVVATAGDRLDRPHASPDNRWLAFIVRHFHSTKGISTSFGEPITAEGFLYEAAEESAHVWKLTPARQP